MNFSAEWDAHYREVDRLSLWPWSDLVSYVMRYARPQATGFRVLELGCGAGANIPFFENLKVEYFAVEGSPAIVSKLHERFPALKDRIVAGDFTTTIPFDGEFDLVVDRSSLTHNTTAAIEQCLAAVHAKLKPGGKFIGIDWFSTANPQFQRGDAAGDAFTRGDFPDGQFAGVGRVHFSDKAHLLDLFKDFRMSMMEHKLVQQEIPDPAHSFATWNLVACKT
ncbi:hypothetical protein BH11PSE11_BH11PSE11_16520 [soil metagenome]